MKTSLLCSYLAECQFIYIYNLSIYLHIYLYIYLSRSEDQLVDHIVEICKRNVGIRLAIIDHIRKLSDNFWMIFWNIFCLSNAALFLLVFVLKISNVIYICYWNGYHACEKVFAVIFNFSSLFSIKIIPAKTFFHLIIPIQWQYIYLM